MLDDQEEAELLEAVKRGLAASRGYADFDTWPDRRVKEAGLGRDFAEAYLRAFGEQLQLQLTPEDADPPDLITPGGIGIELTELVDQSLVEAAVRDKRAGLEPRQYRHWTAIELIETIRAILRTKDRVVPRTSTSRFWLVIHTDEHGLSPEMVSAYLEAWTAEPCSLVDRCFLLMSYFPQAGGRPVFELPVSRAA